MSEPYDIGACLIEARLTQGLSQRELANRLGLHQQQVARWEREGYRRVSLARLSAVAGMLGVYLGVHRAAPLTVAEARAAYAAVGEASVFSPSVVSVADLGGVISRLRASAADLQLRYGVSKIGVYGSFARGEQRPDSDVDLIVEVDEPTMERVFGAERALSGILGREVQLGSLDSINARVRSSVEEDLVHVWPT